MGIQNNINQTVKSSQTVEIPFKLKQKFLKSLETPSINYNVIENKTALKCS